MIRPRSAALLALLLLTGCTASPPVTSETPVASDAPTSAAPSTADPTASPSSTGAPLGPPGWTTYESARYGFRIGHPPDWIVTPSARAWTTADANQWNNTAQEWFLSPDDNALVTAWSTPYAGEATPAGVLAWVEQYCSDSDNVECATIGDRAEPLCHGPDCHPGLLVPFLTDTQAFFTGGEHEGTMVVVAVWRPHDWRVEGFDDAQDLLEAFLATMDVRPEP